MYDAQIYNSLGYDMCPICGYVYIANNKIWYVIYVY